MVGMVRRFWPWLVAVVVVGGGAAVARPHAWAWHHHGAGREAVAHFHADDARFHLDTCLATWPGCVEAHILDARAARLAGDFPAAEEHLRAAQRLQNPPSDDLVREWALFHVASGDLDGDAGDYVRNEIRNHPDPDESAREALVEGCLRTYRVVDALDCLGPWLDARPDEVEALSLRGDLYWQIGALAQSVDDYQRVVELDPQRRQARERLAAGLTTRGRHEEALKHLAVVRQWKPEDPAVETSVARCYAWLDRPDDARRTLDAVLARRPDYGPALLERGRTLAQAGRPAEAEPWLRRAVEAMPHDYTANFTLADALEKAGKIDEASEQRARAEKMKDRDERFTELTTRQMTLRPRDPALHCEVGRLYLERGNKAAGEAWLLSALRLDPHYRPAHESLAQFYEAEGEAEKAAYHRAEARQES